jgi:glycosyltransferase involved in cell wall biosynthesis
VNKKLNVLIIGEYFPPDIGGAATRVSNVSKGLIMNNCTVTVITAFPHYPTGKIPAEYKFKPLKVEYTGKTKVIRTFVLPLESKGLFRRLMVFWSFIASSMFAFPLVGKVDVIWAANPDVFVLVPAIAYGGIKRKPIVSNVDDLIIEDLYDLGLVERGSAISQFAEFCARFLFSKVKGATPISPGYIPTIARYGVDKRKIEVIRGGVDLGVFKPSQSYVTNQKFTVLYSGGFSIAYDFEQIFQAAKILYETHPDVEFIIQGKGESLPLMHARIATLKLRNVKILDKLLTREAVGELLNTADVLILPLASFKTPYRGMSSKLYEYQAVGKPIICISDGLPGDFVMNTYSGIRISPGDVYTLVSAITKLKNEPKLRQTMGHNGRDFVEHFVSISAIGFQLKALFLSQK